MSLGRSIFVVATKFEGEVDLHIRKKIVNFLPEMENYLNMNDHDATVEFKRHLGGNRYVSINKGYPCIDICKF